MVKRYENINFIPPKIVSNNADLGLRLRQKTGKGGLTTKQAGDLKIGSGVARATSLKNRSKISPEVIKKMVNFFKRPIYSRAFYALVQVALISPPPSPIVH